MSVRTARPHRIGRPLSVGKGNLRTTRAPGARSVGVVRKTAISRLLYTARGNSRDELCSIYLPGNAE